MKTIPTNDAHWQYQDGLRDYFCTALGEAEMAPSEPFAGDYKDDGGEVEWVVAWRITDGDGGGDSVTESYVNLIPTPQGGTHLSGFRTGLTEAIREFCEFRDLLPRGVKLTHEDVWSTCVYVLSVRITEPQFSGQAKERLSSRQAGLFVQTAVKDAFSLWLNQHIDEAEKNRAYRHRQRPTKVAGEQTGQAQENHRRPCPTGQTGGLHQRRL